MCRHMEPTMCRHIVTQTHNVPAHCDTMCHQLVRKDGNPSTKKKTKQAVYTCPVGQFSPMTATCSQCNVPRQLSSPPHGSHTPNYHGFDQKQEERDMRVARPCCSPSKTDTLELMHSN